MELRIRHLVRIIKAVERLDDFPSSHNGRFVREKLNCLTPDQLSKLGQAVDELRFATRDLENVTLAGVENEQ